MTTPSLTRATVMALLLLSGCSNKTAAEPAGGAVPPDQGAAPAPTGDSERPSMTAAECEAKQGRVIGDIGDGAIHRPDYRCEGGQPPLASVRATEGEPVAIEGQVCCPAAP